MSRNNDKNCSALEAETRSRILDAAMQILDAQTSDKLTTDMIAEAAGMSVGTLYNYFPQKSDLITAVAFKALETFDTKEAAIAGCDISIEDKLLAYSDYYHTHDKEKHRIHAVLSNSDLDSALIPINKQRERTLERLESMMGEVARYWEESTISPRLLMWVYLGVARGIRLVCESHPEKDVTVKDMAKLTVDIFLNGVKKADLPETLRACPSEVNFQSAKIDEFEETTTRRKIIDAIQNILKQQPKGNLNIDLISMNQIAKEAGLAKGTLYNHFKNKDELLAYAIMRPDKKVWKKIDEIASNKPIAQKLAILAASILLTNSDWCKIAYAIFDTKSDSLPLTRNAIENGAKNTDKWLAKIMEDAVAKGFFRDIPIDYLIRVFTSIINCYVGVRLHFEPDRSASEDAVTIVNFFINGVAAK